MITFTSMLIENFLSFGKTEVDLHDQGLTLVEGENFDDASSLSNGCLAAGTLIDVPRDLNKHPLGIPIESLVGTQPLVYAYDRYKKQISLVRASRVWKTGRERVFEVRFTHQKGRYNKHDRLIGTFDHPVLLRNGKYKALGNLRPGDRLMPLYRRCMDGQYVAVNLNNGVMRLENRIVGQRVKGAPLNKGEVAHHKNENKLDNTPSNIEVVNKRKHAAHHWIGPPTYDTHPRGMLGKKHSQQTRRKISRGLRKRAARLNHKVTRVPKLVGQRDVYDITVPTLQNFVANGVVVHNSGKSALIDALVWCLFGTTLRGYENDEVINRRVGDDCMVSVAFEGGEASEQFVITRARRHSKLKNQLRISREDEDMTLASNAETQEVVEKLLGCSLRTFLSSVVFGQDRAYRFSSLTDKEQKDVLDEVLGVERFAEACITARALSQACGAAVLNAEGALDKVRSNHEQLSEELDELNAKNAKFEEAHEEKLDAEREKLKAAQKRASQDLGVDLADLRDKLAKQRDTYEADGVATVVSAKKTSALYRDCESMRREVVTLAAMIKSLSNKTCPTCGQSIKAKTNVDDYKADLAIASEKLANLETEYGAADLAEKKARAAIIKLAASVRETENAIQRSVSSEADTKAFKMRADDHKRRIKEIEAETNPYASMIEKAEKKLTKLGSERELLATQLGAEQARQKVASFWVDAFGTKGLRSLLLDTSLPILNAEARRVSSAITGGSISIEFSATSDLKNGKTVEKFEVRVVNKHGAASYNGNSAGERAKVDLCVGLAIQRLVASRSSATFNTIFIDEAFDHLDSTAHELVLEVLGEIDKESIFVVSHDEDLKAFFPNTMTVRKKGGFSKVIQ